MGGSSCGEAQSPEGKERMRGERDTAGEGQSQLSAETAGYRRQGQLEGRTRRLLKPLETRRRLRTDMGRAELGKRQQKATEAC